VARLSVIGTGYLGLTHAVCMASVGHSVVALDIDEDKIASLHNGVIPFHEPGLAQMLVEQLDSGRLAFTTSWQHVADNADIHFLCVGTPQLQGSNAADMSQVFGAIELLAPLLSAPCLVVGKSTVPVGTAQSVADKIVSLAPAGQSVHLAWNPEFLREGFAIKDTLHPDRIVLGIQHDSDVDALKDVYETSLEGGTPLVITDYPTAELVKVAANAFLATKISFINAFADLADVVGADVSTLADAIGHDTRIGRRFLNAGVGFGGGCLPKDIRALQARATELGLADQFAFLTNVDAINKSRRSRVVDLATDALGGNVSGKNITVLGAAFKPDSDDVRDSPALDIAATLAELGAHVTVHDPEALHNVRALKPLLATDDDVLVALSNADLVLHLTEWTEYRELDPSVIGSMVNQRIVIDGRNVLDRDAWSGAGWQIIYLGKPGSPVAL